MYLLVTCASAQDHNLAIPHNQIELSCRFVSVFTPSARPSCPASDIQPPVFAEALRCATMRWPRPSGRHSVSTRLHAPTRAQRARALRVTLPVHTVLRGANAVENMRWAYHLRGDCATRRGRPSELRRVLSVWAHVTATEVVLRRVLVIWASVATTEAVLRRAGSAWAEVATASPSLVTSHNPHRDMIPFSHVTFLGAI